MQSYLESNNGILTCAEIDSLAGFTSTISSVSFNTVAALSRGRETNGSTWIYTSSSFGTNLSRWEQLVHCAWWSKSGSDILRDPSPASCFLPANFWEGLPLPLQTPLLVENRQHNPPLFPFPQWHASLTPSTVMWECLPAFLQHSQASTDNLHWPEKGCLDCALSHFKKQVKLRVQDFLSMTSQEKRKWWLGEWMWEVGWVHGSCYSVLLDVPI